MFATLGFFSLLTVSGRPPTPQPASFYYRPRIEVWTNRGDDAYASGQAARVSFRTEQDAYVTLFRVDTDGRVRVLFPREPWDDNFARGGRQFEVDGHQLSSEAFTIDDYPGVGYLFAVASADPFRYDDISTNEHWDYRVIADGRVRGDPYVFVRPYRPQPRFIFKDWGNSRPSREEFVTRERERPVNDNTRRGVTGRDLGGAGIIPPPVVRGGDNGNRRGSDFRGRDANKGGISSTRDNEPGRGQDRPDRRDNLNNGDRPERRDRTDSTRLEQPRIQPTVRSDDQRRIEPRVVEPRRDDTRRDQPQRVE